MEKKFNAKEWLERCKTCKHSRKNATFGITCRLKTVCTYEERKVIDEPIQTEIESEADKMHLCHKCKNLFFSNDMSAKRIRGQVYYHNCRQCQHEIDSAYRERKKKKKAEAIKNLEGTTICKKCGLEKPKKDFDFNVRDDGSITFLRCNDCRRARCRENYKKTRSAKWQN